MSTGMLHSVSLLRAPPADPRNNAFDWETWHEIDVLSRELAPCVSVKQPVSRCLNRSSRVSHWNIIKAPLWIWTRPRESR
jgi:hypothetical protein